MFDLIGGTLPAEIDPDLIAYRDDARGTLMKMYTSSEHWRDWCPRCKWTRRQICNATTESGDGSSSPSLDDLGGIWLHAHRWGALSHLWAIASSVCLANGCCCPFLASTALFVPRYLTPYCLACSYKVPESGIDVEAPLPAWAGCGEPMAI